MTNRSVKISTSVTDFAPLFSNLEFLFKGLKKTGIDGIELVVGLKSRWSIKEVRNLSEKYSIPITSIHQPVWSGLGLYFDEGFFDLAQALGTNKIVCHPLPRTAFSHPRMKTYLKRLSKIQKEKNVEILIENLPQKYNMKLVSKLFPVDKTANDILQLFSAAEQYNLKVTLDIDHLHLAAPHKEQWFKKMLPLIGNIHLSSFDENKKHLPVYLGDLDTKGFLDALHQMNYRGLITFEIYYPSLINPFSYDFEAIRKSVVQIKGSI